LFHTFNGFKLGFQSIFFYNLLTNLFNGDPYEPMVFTFSLNV